MSLNFRTLNGNEINVRVQRCTLHSNKENATAIYLLYKDARCDMNILDETVGTECWQRTHEVIDGNLYCSVGIYFKELNQWVWKQDVGVESNTEAEKGQASDSFKRACFNWGIGRELYTSPLIKIKLNKDDFYIKNDKAFPTISLDVSCIMYDENRNIIKLVLTDNKGAVRFQYDKAVEDAKKTIPANDDKPKEKGFTKEELEKQYKDIVMELTKAGVDIADEKVANWIKKNAKTKEINCDLLSKDEIKAVNTAMIYLLQQKKVGSK